MSIQQLASTNEDLAIYRELIEGLPIGVVVVEAGPRRKVVLRNAAAVSLCGEGSGVALTARTIRFIDNHNDEWLQDRLRILRTGVPKESVEAIIRTATGRLAVMLTALRRRSANPFLAILMRGLEETAIGDPGIGFLGVNSITNLRGRWGLTKSEAQLVVALLGVGSIAGAAKACGITVGTARQYLKRIYSKVDVDGKTNLILRLGLNRI